MNIAFPYHGTNPSGACHRLVWGRRKRGKVARKTPEGGGFSCSNLCSVQSMHNYSNYVFSLNYVSFFLMLSNSNFVPFAKGIVSPVRDSNRLLRAYANNRRFERKNLERIALNFIPQKPGFRPLGRKFAHINLTNIEIMTQRG